MARSDGWTLGLLRSDRPRPATTPRRAGRSQRPQLRPAADAYYVGIRNFSSIAKVESAPGTCEWVLGTYGATIKFAAGSARFLHEHQFEVSGTTSW